MALHRAFFCLIYEKLSMTYKSLKNDSNQKEAYNTPENDRWD